jgi:hypothetical protein
MNRSAAHFLQFVIVLLGAGMLALMLWEPHLEGRNIDATLFQIYFQDPFLAYAYTASIPGFMLLYQAYQALGHVRENNAFSPATLKAVRTVKYCALAVIGFLVGGESWLFLYMSGKDDIAGGVAIGLFFILIFSAIAIIAAMFERVLRKGVEGGPGLRLSASR